MQSSTRTRPAGQTAARPGMTAQLRRWPAALLRWPAALRGWSARLRHRARARRAPRVGGLLVRERIITAAQLERALERQPELALPIGRLVVEMGLADEDAVLDAINQHFRIAASSLTENIAGLIRSRAESRRTLTRVRRLLRVRLSLLLIGAMWAAILALSLVMLSRHQEQLTEGAVELGAVSLNFLAENAKTALLDGNLLQLNATVKAATGGQDIVYGAVTDRAGVVRAHTDPAAIGSAYQPGPLSEPARIRGEVAYHLLDHPSAGRMLHLSRDVTFRGKRLGAAHLGVSLRRVSQQVRRESMIVGALSLLIVAFGIVLAMQQGSRLLRPFSALLATVGRPEAEREYRVRLRPRHEFEDLASSFDTISREVSQKLMMERSLGRYVNPEVMEMIRERPEEPWLKGRRGEATVLFTDVRGFTATAEQREPEAVVDALNEVFEIATAAVLSHGGYVDKYIGDALLAVFGVPGAHDDHPLRAVQAAVSMQKALRRAARKSLNPFLDRIGIGVNTGIVVSGNIGSQEKMEYTVIGDCVNVASRLNGLAGAGEIIVSESVAERMPRHLVTLKALDAQPVKGKAELVQAYKVLKTEL